MRLMQFVGLIILFLQRLGLIIRIFWEIRLRKFVELSLKLCEKIAM